MTEKSHPPSLLGSVLKLTTMAAGGWIAYSHFAVDHQVTLPDAIDAERVTRESAVAGEQSFYRSGADQAGTPLLLLHSINAAPSAFEVKPLFDHYRSTRPVYALDLPGFGFSERRDRRYTPDLFADTIIEFVRDEIGGPADVIALSLTAEFAARAALRQPDLFRSLAFISPTGLNPTDLSFPENALYNFLTFSAWSQAIFDLVVTRPSIRYYVGQSFVGEMPPDFVEYAYATSHQPGARHAPFYFVSGQLFTPGVRSAYYNYLTVPTLAIYDRDPNVQFDKLPDVLAANDHWQAARIEPTLGLPHWEKLPETAAALDAFWAGLA